MKRLIILLLVAPLFQGCNQQAPTGQFQIVAGTCDELINNTVDNSSSPRQIHGIFKIDTQTGRTWIYLDVIDLKTNGASITEGWREIKDVSTSFQKPN
jgi:hypothetical protein